MEALLATNKEAPPRVRCHVPLPTNQAPNNHAQRGRGKERRGQSCRKRMKVLNNPEKLAFRRWKDIPEPWTYKHCKRYIEWCHFGKAFKQDLYLAHLSPTKKI